MRPIKLIISAFGPYASLVEIDFDLLGDNGLYLITGDTGAGKTTIFDAISFALFGAASGDNREASMFRSKYASPQTPTFVELTFLYHGNVYRVRRVPEYMRSGKRGDRMILQKSEAELTLPGGTLITKTKEVNARIIEILGITRAQFCQISMLAQGEFLKLLNASTEERQAVFRKVFNTAPYQILQERIKKEAAILSREYELLSSSIEKYKALLILMYDNDVETQIIQDKQKLSMLQTEAASIDDIINQTALLLGRRESLDKSVAQRDLEEKELAACQLVLEKEKNAFSLVENNPSEIKSLLHEITLASDKLPQYDHLDKLNHLIFENKTRYETCLAAKDTNSKALANLAENYESYKHEYEPLKEIISEKFSLESQLSEVSRYRQELLSLQKSFVIYDKLCSDYDEAVLAFNSAQSIATDAQNKYSAGNLAFLNAQAGILASTLKDGQMCPVCGSYHHPNPATYLADYPDEKTLKKLQKTAELLQKEAAELSTVAGAKKALSHAKKEELISASKAVINCDEFDPVYIMNVIDDNLTEINSSLASLQQKLVANQERIVYKATLEKRLLETENIIKQSTQKQTEINEQITLLNADIIAMQREADSLSETLIFQNKKEASDEINKLKRQADLLQAAYDNARISCDLCEKKIRMHTSAIAALSQQIDADKYLESSQQLNSRRDEYLNKRKNINRIIHAVSSRLERNLNAAEYLQKENTHFSEIEKKLVQVKSLAETANGNISGKEKIMLETFVQMMYLDRVLAHANIRFMQMSKGRYELMRRRQSDNRQSQSGLDLDILDHYNGSARSVKTLSGGESFLASLSLALGLSDEIQASAGGMQLDTMFVDEGFGSLDSESLTQAINSLSELTAGHRLVGIISHVPELKEKIDRQINVKKLPGGGSNLEVLI